jgi:hypothetical protein
MNPDIRINNEPSFDWQNTALHLAMKEAIDAGLYDPSGYAPDWNTDPEKAAVAYTEYTYLVNWSMWDMSVYWDGGSLSPEWDDSLKTPAGMLANNPLGYALFNTYFAPVLSKPNFATIESIFGENDTGVSGYVVDTGASNVVVQANTSVTQDLTVNGTTNIISPNITGTVTHTGNRSQNNVDITGNLTINGPINVEREFHNLQVTIDDNFITTVSNNDNLELRASGSGSVVFQELTEIRGNISANNLTTENININDGLNLEFLESSTDIKIFDNVITTTNSNSNLELRTAGTGSVYLQNLEMHNGVIENTSPFDSTSRDIIFEPTENMIVNSTGALIVPVGSAFVGNTGDIRLNSDSQIFESTGATDIINYGGVFSANKQTSVTADSTSNTLRFIINGAVNPLDSTNLVGEVNSQSFSIHSIQVDDISFDNNTIVTNVSNSNLDLAANGTGEFKVGNFTIKDNLLKGNNNPLTFKNTDFGYIKFNTTKAIAIPAGTNGERPVTDPEIGDTRWNTDGQQLETWNGTEYVSAAGDSAGISENEFNDLLLEYTIIFG